MTVIAGVHHVDGRPETKVGVARMLDVMADRGPGGIGTWSAGPVTLGCGALAFTPESVGEVQPLPNGDGTLHLVADARIDNRDELGAALGVPLAQRATLGDAQWILRAYEAWGEECADRLEGDFAFVVWDQARQRLFGARDGLGIKPFFYTSTRRGRTFRFASEPRPLVGGPDGVPSAPNLELMARYVLNRFGDPEATLYEGVHRLPGGHTITVDGVGLRVTRYWAPDPEVRHDGGGEDCAEQFLELFGQAVAARCRTVGPVGVYLSGGLDSSSIVCAAKRDVATLSLVFDGLACDERAYIEAVVGESGVTPTYVPYAEHRDALDFGQVDNYRDVMYGVTQYATSPLAQAAQARGVRTVLSGIGGDDILLARRGRRSHNPLTYVRRRPRVPRVVTDRWAAAGEATPPLHALVAGRTTTLAVDGQNRLSARFGVEVRYPFLDRRLADFTLGLPDGALRGEQTKLVLRRAMAGLLPETVRTRSGKAEFSSIVDNELRVAQADAVASLLATSRLVELGLLDQRRLIAVWDDYRRGSRAATVRWTVQSVLGLELWLRASIGAANMEVGRAGHGAGRRRRGAAANHRRQAPL